jgi:hypothetical protein
MNGFGVPQGVVLVPTLFFGDGTFKGVAFVWCNCGVSAIKTEINVSQEDEETFVYL